MGTFHEDGAAAIGGRRMTPRKGAVSTGRHGAASRTGRAARRRETFTAFYEAHYERVFRAAALFCGEREVARDASQEAFVRAFERWGRLEGASWADGWVMTTAFNLCRRSLRRKTPPSPDPAANIPSPSKPAERLDLVNALRRLPHRQRQVLVLHYYGDHTIEAIARMLDLSTGSVKTHLTRGRRTLMQALGTREVEHGP